MPVNFDDMNSHLTKLVRKNILQTLFKSDSLNYENSEAKQEKQPRTKSKRVETSKPSIRKLGFQDSKSKQPSNKGHRSQKRTTNCNQEHKNPKKARPTHILFQVAVFIELNLKNLSGPWVQRVRKTTIFIAGRNTIREGQKHCTQWN